MKKLIQFTTILMILPILGFCQNKFSVGANVNTEINFLKFKNAPFNNGRALGYSIGLQTQYSLNEKTFLRSGINYQKNKYRHKISLRWSTGHLQTDQIDLTIQSIGIPIDFGYRIKSKNQKINYLIGLGGLFNLHLDDKTKSQIIRDQDTPSSFESHTIENEIDQSRYSIGIFGGIEIRVNDKMILGIEPNVRLGSNFLLSTFSNPRRIESGITLRITRK